MTEQWSYTGSDPDLCTLSGLAAHYFSLLQQASVAAALGGSRKLTALEENSTELRQGRRYNYGLRRLESLAAKELAIKRRGETTLERQTWR